ncbi:SprT-like domain-containing protein [Butyrivibrio sp. YAB3001]|uniref:SprT-like domain-containing protein n=1 Tax=Butyrivibrio sp. YAB3001 TaxID=1520812 RepID=UPI0008F683E7|nr:SprT-like domain-containing protein [Butyrivibrio sp. YAB3001]SFB99517.1 SprT-like family protein [Butyrivibrio sp. YAB3001]
MKDFKRLQQECMKEVKDAGIVPGTIGNWMINTRAKKRWGYCRKEIDGTYEIQIAQQLLFDDRISDKACKETIIHEILHTCPGCMNHKEKWKSFAQLMNDKYGYNIKRTTSCIEKGVEETPSQKHISIKYVFTCSGCGAKIYRRRKSKFTKYYKNYICTRCSTQGWKREIVTTSSKKKAI